MARDNENDVTDGRDDEEFGPRILRNKKGEAVGRLRSSQEIREMWNAPFSSEELGNAIAKASQRMREEESRVKEAPLPEIVRASVRCGYETSRRVMSDGSAQMVTAPGSVAFKADETADGKAYTVVHGRPIHLKREAFQRYARDGKVVLAQ